MNPFSKFARLARRRRRDAWVRAFRAGPEMSASVRPAPSAQSLMAEQRRVNRIVALCGSLTKAQMIVDLMADLEPRERGQLRDILKVEYAPGDHTRAALYGRHYRRPAPVDPPPASSLQEAALDAMDADWRGRAEGNGPVVVNIMNTPKRCNRCGERID